MYLSSWGVHCPLIMFGSFFGGLFSFLSWILFLFLLWSYPMKLKLPLLDDDDPSPRWLFGSWENWGKKFPGKFVQTLFPHPRKPCMNLLAPMFSKLWSLENSLLVKLGSIFGSKYWVVIGISERRFCKEPWSMEKWLSLLLFIGWWWWWSDDPLMGKYWWRYWLWLWFSKLLWSCKLWNKPLDDDDGEEERPNSMPENWPWSLSLSSSTSCGFDSVLSEKKLEKRGRSSLKLESNSMQKSLFNQKREKKKGWRKKRK